MPLQGQPRRRAPLQSPPSPRDALAQLQAATLRSRLRGWSPALGGRAESAPAHTHGPHTRERTPRRAHALTPGRTQAHRGHRRALGDGGWGHSRIPHPPTEGAVGHPAPPRPAPRTRQSGRRFVGCKVCSSRPSRERAGAGSAELHAAQDSCDRWPGGVDARSTALPQRANPNTSSRLIPAVRVLQGHSSCGRGAQPTLSPPCPFS